MSFTVIPQNNDISSQIADGWKTLPRTDACHLLLETGTFGYSALRNLSNSDRNHCPPEKEALAIDESFRRFSTLLKTFPGTAKTDEKGIAFIFSQKKSNKKTRKSSAGKSSFLNIALLLNTDLKVGDALLWTAHLKTESRSFIFSLHDKLAHHGVTRVWHYINFKNFLHTLEDVKHATTLGIIIMIIGLERVEIRA